MFSVAPNLKPFAAEVVAPKAPWKFLDIDNFYQAWTLLFCNQPFSSPITSYLINFYACSYLLIDNNVTKGYNSKRADSRKKYTVGFKPTILAH